QAFLLAGAEVHDPEVVVADERGKVAVRRDAGVGRRVPARGRLRGLAAVSEEVARPALAPDHEVGAAGGVIEGEAGAREAERPEGRVGRRGERRGEAFVVE